MSASHPHCCPPITFVPEEYPQEGIPLDHSSLPASDPSCFIAYNIVCGMVLGCWIQPDFLFFNVLFNPEVRSILVFYRLDEPVPFNLGGSFLFSFLPCGNIPLHKYPLFCLVCSLYSKVLAFSKLEKLSPTSVSILFLSLFTVILYFPALSEIQLLVIFYSTVCYF